MENFLKQFEVENTQDCYRNILKRFRGLYPEIPEGHQWMQGYRNQLLDLGLGHKTVNMHLNVTAKYIKYQTGRVVAYERLKENAPEIEFLKDDQIKKLLSESDLSLRVVISFMLATGVRVGEMAAISGQQFNEIPKEVIVLGKGHKQRVVIISEACRALLHTGYLFGQPWNVRQFQRALAKFGIHPHQLRHTFATKMLHAGADITEVQKMLGHAHINTTQIYTHITQDRLREVWGNYQKTAGL